MPENLLQHDTKTTEHPADAGSPRPGDRPSRPTVAVTVVTSNEDLIIPCLDSLLKNGPGDYCDLKILVAWNAPWCGGPPLPTELVKRYPGLVMIESSISGFAENENVLLTNTLADYYFIINDDIVFLPGSIQKPLEYLERPENRKVGMLAIRLLNSDGTLQPSTYSSPGILRIVLALSRLRSLLPLTGRLFRFASFLGLGRGRSRYWPHDETVEVETFRGSYMVVRHEALREVGLMDLMGGEETEWHIRFREKGWKVVFHHEAEVIHLGSATVSKDPYRDLIELRGALNIYYKHMPPWRYALLRACCFLIYVGKYLAASLRWTSTAQDVARKALRLIIRWPNVRSGRNSE